MRQGQLWPAVLLTVLPTLAGCYPPPSGMILPPGGGGPFGEGYVSGPVMPLATLGANPLFIPASNQEVFWEGLVDVVDDYFRIHSEDRVRQIGNVLVEGKIQTYPLTGATVLEPWRKDSVGAANRWESTFQSVRRLGLVRVIPTSGGNLVEVQVQKELENLERPERATATTAAVKFDKSLDRLPASLDQPPRQLGWIGVGRDGALEQRILADLQARFGVGG